MPRSIRRCGRPANNAARFTRSCKAATRKPTSRGKLARSVDDQPRACSQHRRARLSLQTSAREGLAETRRGLGQAAQNDARFGGADRRKTDARAVESRSDQRASGEGWRRLYQSRAHLSACLERQERRGHAVSSLASQRQKIQQAQGQEFGARADFEPRRHRSAASYCRRKKPHRRLGRCCWPPDRAVPGSRSRSFTSSHIPTARSECSTSSSASLRVETMP